MGVKNELFVESLWKNIVKNICSYFGWLWQIWDEVEHACPEKRYALCSLFVCSIFCVQLDCTDKAYVIPKTLRPTIHDAIVQTRADNFIQVLYLKQSQAPIKIEFFTNFWHYIYVTYRSQCLCRVFASNCNLSTNLC